MLLLRRESVNNTKRPGCTDHVDHLLFLFITIYFKNATLEIWILKISQTSWYWNFNILEEIWQFMMANFYKKRIMFRNKIWTRQSFLSEILLSKCPEFRPEGRQMALLLFSADGSVYWIPGLLLCSFLHPCKNCTKIATCL